MNREIKFRAWDTENKCFHQDMDGVGGYYYNFGVSTDDDVFVLQQYTGLKDKNGKEIYEGDIVRGDNGKEYFMGIVHFKDGSFWVYEHLTNVDKGVFSGDIQKETIWSIDKLYEVIGNIYENPELLK